MILKIRLNEENIQNISIIKNHFFDVNDKITSGYIIGLTMDNLPDDIDWEQVMSNRDKSNGESKSTSLSLRQDTYEKLINLQTMLLQECKKLLPLSKVIGIVLDIVANNIKAKEEKIKKLTVIEWNINGRSGYVMNIPVNLIVDEIWKINPDIVILTEFVKTLGFMDLKAILEEKYYVYTNEYEPNKNGVLIAIAKKEGISVTTEAVKNFNKKNMPDFLEKDIIVNNNRKIKIIGSRIRVKTRNNPTQQDLNEDFQYRNEQFNNLISYAKSVKQDTIIAGDFNHGAIKSEKNKDYIYTGTAREYYSYQQIWRKTEPEFKLVTPHRGDIINKFSYVDKNNVHIKEDHLIISKTLNVEASDYSWDFISPKYGYGTIQASDYKSFAMLPDHAILIAEISF